MQKNTEALLEFTRQLGIAMGTEPQAELLRTVYGCGAGGLVAATTCSSLTRLVDCDRNVGTWACASSLDASSQNLATNGVLCCAP